ncbi:MAG: MqnA/MqnD/SBP family protein [Campylobacterota bacterium]
MVFGSIEYLNLLPFRVYMKKNFARSSMLHYKKGVPSKLNRELGAKRIDAAFISSIKAKKRRCGQLGIVADGAVQSVFVIRGADKKDIESETSNALAHVLGLHGEVIIGDKALKRYLQGDSDLIDLATKWKEMTGLPFVFARLCYNKGYNKRFEKRFLHQKIKIPQYILRAEAKKRAMEPKDILAYLEYISYELGYREKRALKKFYRLTPHLF